MVQYALIEKINELALNLESIKSVKLIGSFGRKDQKANSDIDYQILVDDNFNNV